MASQSILILCLDAYGDLTLRQPLFRSLLDAGNRVAVAVRAPHDGLLRFLDPRIEAVVTDLNPYVTPDATFWARAAALQERVASFAPDLLVSALYNRTFLDQWLLRCSPAPTLGFANPASSDSELDALAPAAPRQEGPALGRTVSVPEDAPEPERNRALLAAILGSSLPDYEPRLRIGEGEEAAARLSLERLGLAPGQYAFGAPAGTVNNAQKAWRPEAFLEMAGHLERRHGLKTLVTGVASEAEALDRLVDAAAVRGIAIARWVGGPSELGELLGLIRLSRLYVGSDTGPMHFAAALDVPVLALFGGGHWPRFLPVARRSFVATRELPCFGCNWECWLPEAACVTTVETAVLLEGADWLLGSQAPDRSIHLGTPLDEGARAMVRDGAARFRGTWHHFVALQRYNGMLESYRDFLVDQKRLLEDERASLHAHIDTQRRSFEESLHASEVEKARRLRTIVQQETTISSMGAEIGRLSSPRGALRVLSAAVMRKAGVFEVVRRSRQRMKRTGRGRTAVEPPRREPRKPGPTRFLDGFVVARALPGDTPELTLEAMHRLGERLGAVLAVHPTPRALQAAVMLASGGARVTWLGEPSVLEPLEVSGIESPAPDLGSWLRATEGATVRGTALLLDAEASAESVRLLGYRLPAGARIVVVGGKPSFEEGWPEPAETGPGFAVYDTPPPAWVDPAAEDPGYRDQRLWVKAPRKLALPDRLPSGRPWPRISIVTVTLNQARFLEATLLSVLRQDYPDLEYIVRDGGSTDGTPEILERYRPQLAHCVSEKDGGQSDALNKGFALATGRILAWLNSDDRYPAGALWRAALAFDRYETDMVVGGCRLVDGDGEHVNHVHHAALPVGRAVPLPLDRILELDDSWLKGEFFYQPEVFWTRDIWDRAGGGVAAELFYSMDYELWARMAHAGARIVHVPETLAIYRMHAAQKTAGVHLPYLPELRQVAAGLRRRWSLP